MSEHIDAPRVVRNALGQLQPGSILNPAGPPARPPLPAFDRRKLIQTCVDRDYEPIGALIDLSRSKDATPYLQYEIHKEIASFLYPKRKAIALTNEDGEQATIKISWDDPPPEQKKQFEKGMRKAEAAIMDAIIEHDDSE